MSSPQSWRSRHSNARDDRGWRIVFVVALIWIAALLHRGQPLAWDEIEFYRATRWTGEGRVPFRDFWEHHTPLQWIVFAPVARFIANGPGADAIVAMRWAQVALWVAIFVLSCRWPVAGGRGGVAPGPSAMATGNRQPATWWALVFLVVSPLFVRSAIEYRVDVLGNAAYLAAIAVALKRRWIAFGALMSLGVLANMRLAPLAIVTAAVLAFQSEGRWRFQVRALTMIAGAFAVAAAFVGWLFATGAWQPFLDGVAGYNTASAKLLEVNTFYQFAAPLWQLDPAAIVLWCAAIAGTVLALRDIGRPGVPQIVALLFIASLMIIAAMEVQYEYHFQLTYLLMVPLAALAFTRTGRWQALAAGVAAVALLLAIVPYVSSSFGEAMRYQDFVMREVDRRTKSGERVFDGNGYALRREPAYRYWFLTTGVRFLASRGEIEPYDIAANPPAAVIYNLRMQRWFEIFPKTAAYAVRHYVPLTRDLWVPGMTATLQPQRSVTWIAPAAGRYTIWASESLLRHPWLTQPLVYASLQGERATRYAIPLQRLPLAQQVEWNIDGIAITGRTVELRKGSRVTVFSREPGAIGVMLAPADVSTLAIAPAEEFQF